MKVKRYKCPILRGVSSGDLLYSEVTIVDNIIFYVLKVTVVLQLCVKRVNLKCSHHNNKIDNYVR